MSDPLPIVLKYVDWPRSDQLAWQGFFTAGDIFDEAGPFHHWSEGSRTKRQQSYGQWLSFLARRFPDALNASPVDRITLDRARVYLTECEARLVVKSTAGLFLDLYLIAREMDPARDWGWLQTVANRLVNKSNQTSLPPAHPISAGSIYNWSLRRMAEVEASASVTPLQRAIRFRQAFMIGFLIAWPVRRRAILAMTIDEHVLPSSCGFSIRFRAVDMKDRKDRSSPLPVALVEPMRAYLGTHRPILLNGNQTSALWINQYGQPITPDGFARELPKVTQRHLEVSLRPHAFRHIAATSIAEFDPAHVGIIRDILGHATLEMSEKHYNRASGIESCNALQSIVEDIRKDVPRMGRAKAATQPHSGKRAAR